MSNRFPKDCWGKECSHFHVQDLSIDDLVCYCDILKLRCDACDENFSPYSCPLKGDDNMSEKDKDYGKYGMMRLKYLKENRPTLCSTMLSSGELSAHLLDVNARATAEVERLVEELKKKNPPKDVASPEWAAHMSVIKAQAEEIVRNNLIFV